MPKSMFRLFVVGCCLCFFLVGCELGGSSIIGGADIACPPNATKVAIYECSSGSCCNETFLEDIDNKKLLDTKDVARSEDGKCIDYNNNNNNTKLETVIPATKFVVFYLVKEKGFSLDHCYSSP